MTGTLVHGLGALGLFLLVLLAARLRWAPRKEAPGGGPSD
jgi:hypothetical protein